MKIILLLWVFCFVFTSIFFLETNKQKKFGISLLLFSSDDWKKSPKFQNPLWTEDDICLGVRQFSRTFNIANKCLFLNVSKRQLETTQVICVLVIYYCWLSVYSGKQFSMKLPLPFKCEIILYNAHLKELPPLYKYHSG